MCGSLVHRSLLYLSWCLLTSLLGTAYGQKPLTPRQTDSWAKFSPGTRKRVRIVVQKLDAKGNIESTATRETQSFLEKVSEQGYSLRIETTSDVAGKRITTDPQIVRRGYLGEINGETSKVRTTGETNVVINGLSIACQVRQITIQGTGTTRVSTIHYSPTRFPHILHRVMRSPAGATAPTMIQADAIALDMPLHLLGLDKIGSHILTTRRSPLGTTSTLEIHCGDVPGSLVSLTATTRNKSGKVTERSQLDLISYRVVIGEGRQPTSRPRLRLFQRASPR
ncbi:MAG: hypothetical protein VX346_21620 [Planctomycetota bacterium]|nr:hypothetical protein [Planctomycetota bacterium]